MTHNMCGMSKPEDPNAPSHLLEPILRKCKPDIAEVWLRHLQAGVNLSKKFEVLPKTPVSNAWSLLQGDSSNVMEMDE